MSREKLDIERHNELIAALGGESTSVPKPGEYFGLSTETKPTVDIVKGSTYFVIDTGDVHMFDGAIWRLI